MVKPPDAASRAARIAARTRDGEAGTLSMRAPVAWRIAARIAGAVGTSAGSPTPLAPNGPAGSCVLDEEALDLRRVADRRDQVVVEVVRAPGHVRLHQRHARGPGAMPPWIWPSTSVGIDRPPDVVGRDDPPHLHRPELEVDVDLRDLRPEGVRLVRDRPGRRRRAAWSSGRTRRGRAARSPGPPSGSSPSSTTDVVSPSRATTRPSSTSQRRVRPGLGHREQLAAQVLARPAGSRCPTRTSGATPRSCPRRGVRSVSGPTRSIRATGTPRASAAIWARIVFEPWPMSVAPENSTMCPSARTPTSISDGLGSDVLPMPYHMAAIPTPRRTRAGRPLVVPRGVGAHGRPARAQGLEAGGQAGARRRAAGRSRSGRPARSALRSRNSSGSMPSWPARSSISASWAIAACGTPKPRKAPAGGPFV